MSLTEFYSEFETRFPEEKLRGLREQGLRYLQDYGWPTRKEENWKYNSFSEAQKSSWKPICLASSQPKPEQTRALWGPLAEKYKEFPLRVCILNGQFRPELSTLLPEGLHFRQSERWGFSEPKGFFESVLSAYFKHRFEIFLDEGIKISEPLLIMHLFDSSVASQEHSFLVSSLLSYLGKSGSEIKVSQHFCSLESHPNPIFRLHRSQFKLERGAKIESVAIQDEDVNHFHLSQVEYELEEESQCRHLQMALGARVSKMNLKSNIRGSGVESSFYGLTVGKQNQVLDHATEISHLQGGSHSLQLHKAVLDGHATSVFSGRIFIDQKAQKASSEQLNKNLMLSLQAQVQSRPQMEIKADDVKATHGATVGQISEEEIFYLKSRGIQQSEALKLLSFGFADEVLQRFSEEASFRKFAGQALSRHFKEMESIKGASNES